MKKDKFLDQVAAYYAGLAAGGHNLADYVLVLPNKRGAMFLSKYLRSHLHGVAFMPRFVTITAFTQTHCTSQLARLPRLLFTLYKAYCNVMKEKGLEDKIRTFDEFAYWGNVIIEDFNDVDSYLVNPTELFPNIVSEKKLRSTFETEEQLEVARYLGMKEFRSVDEENFWRHCIGGKEGDLASEKFIAIWRVLGDLYKEFNRLLDDQGIAYTGKLSRQACSNICNLGKDELDGKRYGFIGFPVLSASRLAIFTHLKRLGVADFFWDIASPFLHEKGNHAGESILPLARQFPMPGDFTLQPLTFADMARIEVCPVPSNIGQAKIAAHILQEWRASDPKAGYDWRWGVVMPDDKLLVPMLTALPSDVGIYNVAMRVSYNTTPFASLLNSAINLQLKARYKMGTLTYLTSDVFEILSQPYIAMAAPTSAIAIKQYATDYHLYHIEADWIVEHHPDLAFVFAPVKDTRSIADTRAYLMKFFSTLRQKLSKGQMKGAELPYEEKILQAYEGAVDEICSAAAGSDIDMRHQTFFSVLRRLLGAMVASFNSNPVMGLQMMGVEETRDIDFNNLIIMSLNERVFPKKTFSPTFVPPVLRVAYGMPTLENDDVNMAYQFYRLIARAERLSLIYDSRTPGMSKGELSRYVRQLRLLHPQLLKVRKIDMGMDAPDPRALEVNKTAEVMGELSVYLTEGSGRRLSASALKTYVKCPLRFYLETVRGLKIEDFDAEYMDSASFGTILHEMGEIFYNRYKGKVLTAEDHRKLAHDIRVKDYLAGLAKEVMNRTYYHHKYDHNLAMMPAEGRVLSELMASLFVKMLEKEGALTRPDFQFVTAEECLTPDQRGTIRWKVGDRTINFTMSIDRIDFIPGANVLRLIDYKTGGDKIESGSIGQLFTDYNFGAIFQVMTYALAFIDNRPERIGDFVVTKDMDMCPQLYVFNKMQESGLPYIKIGSGKQKKPVLKFAAEGWEADFRPLFVNMIDEIFNPEVPFYPKKDKEKNCLYCPFKDMCN